jgi:hypothetical protein
LLLRAPSEREYFEWLYALRQGQLYRTVSDHLRKALDEVWQVSVTCVHPSVFMRAAGSVHACVNVKFSYFLWSYPTLFIVKTATSGSRGAAGTRARRD